MINCSEGFRQTTSLDPRSDPIFHIGPDKKFIYERISYMTDCPLNMYFQYMSN